MSFRAKLIIGIILIDVGFMAVFSFLQYRSAKQTLREQFAANAEAITFLAAQNSAEAWLQSGEAGVKAVLDRVVQRFGLAYARVRRGSESSLWVESVGEKSAGGAPVMQGSFLENLASNQEQNKVYDTYEAIEFGGKTLGELQIGTSFSDLDASLNRLFAEEARNFLIQFVALIAFVFFLSWVIFRRLALLREACAHVAKGDLDFQTPVTGSDEVTEVARAFNQMAADLKKKIAEADHRKQELVAASKMSSLGEMAAGIAHEINNPLAIIVGCVDQIRDEEKMNPDAMKKLEKISETALRISRIIRALRVFSRTGDNDPLERVNLSALVEDAIELCRERFRKNCIELRTNVQPGIELSGRQTQLIQVLVNLLNNAQDAVLLLPERWVEVRASKEGEWVTLTVTDSGSGIPDPIADKLMQPFFTTKEVGVGTGLGLSISKGIVDGHGGSLALDRSCANTRFTVRLPLVAARTAEKRSA